MVVARDSRLVRWAYFLESRKPYQTSLCALFWRTVLWTPMKVCAMVGGLGMILFVLFKGLLLAFAHAAVLGKFAVVGVIVAGIGIWLFKPKRSGEDARAKRVATRAVDAIENSIIVQGAMAVKSKICPLIELR
jgi:hypothetical protein